MMQPDKVRAEAKKKEDENFRFRSYLKGHADDDELDRQFLRLHKELFADYDCSKCRNCCKMYKGSIPAEDINRDAQYLGITPEQFINAYLEKEEYDMNYQTRVSADRILLMYYKVFDEKNFRCYNLNVVFL